MPYPRLFPDRVLHLSPGNGLRLCVQLTHEKETLGNTRLATARVAEPPKVTKR